MWLHIPRALLLRLVYDVLDDLDDPVQGELVLGLVQDVHAPLYKGILYRGLLVIHVLVQLVIDLDQEIYCLGYYFGIFALESHIPHNIQLVQLFWVCKQLENRLFLLLLLPFIIFLVG